MVGRQIWKPINTITGKFALKVIFKWEYQVPVLSSYRKELPSKVGLSASKPLVLKVKGGGSEQCVNNALKKVLKV